MEVNFRPHHFLCALCFQGRGYSPAFIANFQVIMNYLNSSDGDNVSINIVNQTDSICSPCPNRLDTKCRTEEKINVLDMAHSNALNLENVNSITWGEAKTQITKKITLDKFHQICTTCGWKELGICEKVLTEFLNQ